MFERFTKAAREVVHRAVEESERLSQRRVGTEHLLIALVASDGIAGRVLRAQGLEIDAVRAAVVEVVGPAPGLFTADEADALRAVGIDVEAVLGRIEETFGPDALSQADDEPRRGPFRRRRRGGRFSPRAKKVLELALREALLLKHNYIGTEHILLGLIREGNGLAAKILADRGTDLDALRRATISATKDAA